MTHILPFQKIHTKHCIKKVTEKENQILPSQHTTLMTISKTKYSNANFLIQSHEKGNQWRTLLMNLTSYLGAVHEQHMINVILLFVET